MIDREVHIFDRVYRKVSSLCAKGKFVSTQIVSPTAYPAGCLVEMSNTTVKDLNSSSLTEDYADIMYQLECFAKTKADCKKLYAAADEEMIGMGFTRISGDLIGNAGNVDVLRYVARYRAYIDQNGMICRVP